MVVSGTAGPLESGMTAQSEIVSFDDDLLLLVDADDHVVGYLDKAACHDGDGRLHRAFSVFVLNRAGEVLLQKRAPGKRLWPSYWSNSCCSHPRQGESMEAAVRRRVSEELGFPANGLRKLRFLYKFEYRASFGELGSEHELCWVYVAGTGCDPVVNDTEVEEWKWVSQDELSDGLARRPGEHTPWLKLEWAELLRSHATELLGS